MATWPTAETFTPTAIAPLKLARPFPGQRPASETTLTIRGATFGPPGRVHPPCAAWADDAETRRGRAVAVSTKTYCPTALLPYCPTALLPTVLRLDAPGGVGLDLSCLMLFLPAVEAGGKPTD